MFMSIEKLKDKVQGTTYHFSQTDSFVKIEGTSNGQPLSVSLKIFNKAVNIKQTDLDAIEQNTQQLPPIRNEEQTNYSISKSEQVSINSLARKIYRINWIENKEVIKFDHNKKENLLTITNSLNHTAYTLPITAGKVSLTEYDLKWIKQPEHVNCIGEKIKLTDIVKTTRPDYSRKQKTTLSSK